MAALCCALQQQKKQVRVSCWHHHVNFFVCTECVIKLFHKEFYIRNCCNLSAFCRISTAISGLDLKWFTALTSLWTFAWYLPPPSRQSPHLNICISCMTVFKTNTNVTLELTLSINLTIILILTLGKRAGVQLYWGDCPDAALMIICCCMQEKCGCDVALSAAAVSNQRQRLLDKLSAFDTSCQRLKCLLCEQQKFLSHMADLEQADTVTAVCLVFDWLHIVHVDVCCPMSQPTHSQVFYWDCCCVMQASKQNLEEKDSQIAELRTLCEQQKVCVLISAVNFSN